MMEPIPAEMLNKYPQLEYIFEAISEFKNTGSVQTECPRCNAIINVYRDERIGVLETNCTCGYCKYRMKWLPD
jgi:hypothetical protein